MTAWARRSAPKSGRRRSSWGSRGTMFAKWTHSSHWFDASLLLRRLTDRLLSLRFGEAARKQSRLDIGPSSSGVHHMLLNPEKLAASQVDRLLDSAAASGDGVTLLVPLRHIERRHTGPLIVALMALTDSSARVQFLAGSVRIVFEGYGRDGRMPWLFSPVVRYFAAVHRMWPYWLHFVVTRPDTTLRTVLALLAQRQALRFADSVGGLPVLPHLGWKHRQVMRELVSAVNTLHAAMDQRNQARDTTMRNLRLALDSWVESESNS